MGIERHEAEEAWRRFAARVLAFLESKVASREEAEDLLQEVFVRLHTGLCCLEDWPSLEKWIWRVARNLVIDHYRSRRRTAELDEELESPWAMPDIEEDPAARLAFSLRETVEGLEEPHRGALLLTEYEGLTQAEYARREGISLAAAKSRVLRARETLRDSLLACCHFELDAVGQVMHYEKRCASCDLARLSKDRG